MDGILKVGLTGLLNMVKFGGGVDDDIESLLVDKSLEGGEDSGDRVADVKKLKKNARKPPKPPRPPKGPLILDAADRKLVRELAELAMRKRARVERIKALKKMKAAKVSSLNSGLSAMVVTLIFFLVITFQGTFLHFKVRFGPFLTSPFGFCCSIPFLRVLQFMCCILILLGLS